MGQYEPFIAPIVSSLQFGHLMNVWNNQNIKLDLMLTKRRHLILYDVDEVIMKIGFNLKIAGGSLKVWKYCLMWVFISIALRIPWRSELLTTQHLPISTVPQLLTPWRLLIQLRTATLANPDSVHQSVIQKNYWYKIFNLYGNSIDS